MINLKVDTDKLEAIVREEIKSHLKGISFPQTFWDAKELRRRTSMSWNTIQREFFFDPRFPKRKVGNKWYFPAKEAEEFLLMWLREKP